MAGEYRLIRKLGEGGFGAVYEAEHPLLKRRAAVKVLHRVADKDSDAVLRFISEAQAVNQIRNRHIVDVFSFGKLNDGRHYYIMDLLDGAPLDRWLKQHGKVEVATALQLLTPIADALDLAHQAGIVHRDLKPQNIFLAWEAGGETVPKLLDFGMAKLLGESPVHTVSGTPIGTPLYMSPEQARGERVDQRSDVYALGVLCHELLTGRLPFTGDTTVAVLMAHIIQAPQPVSEVAPELSPLLDAPVLRMLAKEPTARPASAGEALASLRRAAEEAGISVASGPMYLPRPEPAASSAHGPEDTESGLPDFATTEPDGLLRAAASTPSAAQRPLWPFALALLLLGAALGFSVLRPPAAAPAPEVQASATPSPTPSVAATAALTPVTRMPPSLATAPAAPSVTALPSAAPAAAAAPAARPNSAKAVGGKGAAKPAKAPPADAARIPTDLENPF